MKITNNFNLPQVLVDAALNDPYDPGESDISVTRLISPPRLVALAKQHAGDLSEDVSDRLYSLMGQAMHHILERAGDPLGERIIEKRLFSTVNGWVLSGQLDLWEDNVLYDYKFTSTWETINGLKPDKIAQLNVLAWLCRKNNIQVDKVFIVALYRDWSRSQAKRERDYPQSQVGVIEAPVWTDAECEAYIEERIEMHKAAMINLPECTEEDQWARPAKYALMKEGQKKAIRLLDSESELIRYAEKRKLAFDGKLKAQHYVEFRPGEKVRCESYCAASAFCSQFNGA